MTIRRIGIISDVHASPVPLRQALEIFSHHYVTDIICAGDIAGYFDSLGSVIELLKQYSCKTVMGNHDQSYLESFTGDRRSAQFQFIQALPQSMELEFDTIKLFVVHGFPPCALHGGIKLLDQYGSLIPRQQEYWKNKLEKFNYNVLIVGHTHQVYAQQLGDLLVVNPGSTQFNHSCMILELPELSVKTYALENQQIVKSWNFSMLYGSHNHYPSRSH